MANRLGQKRKSDSQDVANPFRSKKAKSSVPDVQPALCSTVTKIGNWTLETPNATPSAPNQNATYDANAEADAECTGSNSTRDKFQSGEPNYTVILATARIRLQIATTIYPICRAICDTGAQANIISAKCVNRIGLPTRQCFASILGVGGSLVSNRKIIAFITPWFESSFQIEAEFLVSEDLSSSQPHFPISALRPKGLTLADDAFDTPGPIDMLLSAEVWAKIIRPQLYKHPSGAIMQNTALGHVILGRATPDEHSSASVFHASSFSFSNAEISNEEYTLEKMLQQFFDAEELPGLTHAKPTQEQAEAEKAFVINTHQKTDGLYVTKIPLKPNKRLGESRGIVQRRFYALERKLQANPDVRNNYIEFMRSFITQNHMQKAPPLDRSRMHYYIPHHHVNSSNKFRVVFDASCKTSTGQSLNSIQLIGQKLQCDLHFQIMRFRRHKYAVTADIEKMYRQIEIDPSQWDLQRIFWREDNKLPLSEYQITRVIYGVASSGFLAVRTMHKCAEDHAKSYPEAAKIITQCFYMDDGLWGADTIDDLKMLCREVKFVLSKGRLELRKWSSNSRAVERLMDGEEAENVLIGEKHAEAKILGLRWLKDSDEFTIFVRPPRPTQSLTKRYIFSEIARVHDPNGYVTPVVIIAKMLMQDIWRIKSQGWDQPVPAPMQQRWLEFVNGLTHLSRFRIPRWLSIKKNANFELHGFCDASSKAYGAVIYVRAVDENNHVNVTLLTSKSKVASITPSTIPREELMATLLGSRLMHQIINACDIYAKQYLWSDSMIALYWIKRSPAELKMFVANRVQAIKDNARHSIWTHVATQDNPADLISRGMSAAEFTDSEFWKRGPAWLSQPKNAWPKPKLIITPEMQESIDKEIKPSIAVSLAVFSLAHNQQHTAGGLTQARLFDVFHYSNDFKHILRITAYVLRFVDYIRLKRKELWNRPTAPLPSEMEAAAQLFIKSAQRIAYAEELKSMHAGDTPYLPKSKLSAMRPILDERGILRVGGRIDKANIAYAKRHPIIIPPRSRLAFLLINQAHEETCHGGVQLMMAHLRTQYWIPNLRRQARTFISRCSVCQRYAKMIGKQLMSELPAVRLNPARPFDVVGVDLAGPFLVKPAEQLKLNTRSKAQLPLVKGWVAVFVCLVTRAVHLEPIMDLSADAFLRAYTRFVSRRGNPQAVYSDNGTNFVASDRLMQEAALFWSTEKMQRYASNNYTKWHFITPGAPHEGGIWEAAVKSMKHHLRRVMGAQKYSYEGVSTLLASIEACLNSRPLCAMSDDPSDREVLTPAHFLVGGPLKLPLPENAEEPSKSMKRLLSSMQAQTQSFWHQWSRDYLHSLMQRPKWRESQRNLEVGQLALLMEERLAPTYWAMGRIIETHKGTDGCVRSVTLKVADGELKRSVRKICVLRTDQEVGYWVEN